MTVGFGGSVTTGSAPASTSTAVRLTLMDTISTRTDRDDGASYAFPSVTCHFANPDGTSRDQSPQREIRSQAVGLRVDRAANHFAVDVGSLDVAFTATSGVNSLASRRSRLRWMGDR